MDVEVKKVFTLKPFFFCSATKLISYLIKAKIYPLKTVGLLKCKGKRCRNECE